MKKLLIFAFIAFNTIAASAYNQVRLVINDGISDQPLKEKIEHAFSVVMTEINRSHERNLGKLEFPETYMYKDARSELNQLWQNDRFRCVEEEVVERLLTTRNGYQVRGIPLIVNSAEGGEELGYQEAVINFDRQGVITSFYYTINPELYSKLRMTQMGDRRHEVADIKDRMMILRKSEVVPSGNKIIYTTQTKQQYLDNLARAFKSNGYIKVTFDDVVIVEHPTIRGIYGVTVHQKWNTARYSDEGYVFMLWDFRNPDAPQIHVRTWQPDYIDKDRGQRLSPGDVFTLGDFDL